MKARYVRVSTPDQNKERQLVKQHPGEEIFIDVCSGSTPFVKRQQGSKLLKAGGVTHVSVHAIDRLGRNLLDILTTLKHFQDSGVTVEVDNLGIKSIANGKPNQAFNLIVTVMGQISQMERETMLERQKEGIAAARAKDAALPPEQRTYKGRIRGSKESKGEVLAKYPEVVKHLTRGQSLRNTEKLAGVSLSTVQKVRKYLVKTE